ncbi:MAG: MBL fold metallo-hydrolase [Euryarchaeota archaeon]|nr:MBL fold metallo-hydrolase [Euryarchaeota archaeon]
MKVTLLGTGAAAPQRRRANTSLAAEHRGKLTVFDCGPETPRRLLEAGYTLDRVDRLVVSHAHGDHILGVPLLLKGMEILGRTRPLHLHGPREALQAARLLTETTFAGFFRKQPYPLRLHGWTGPRVSQGDLRAARAIHGVPAYAVRLGPLVYSGDTSPCPGVVELARGARLLVHEASAPARFEEAANRYGHSSARQAGEASHRSGARRLLLVHLDHRSRPRLLEREAGRETGSDVEAGSDLQRARI